MSYKTKNSPRRLVEYYNRALVERGMLVTALTINSSSCVVEARSRDGGRKVIVAASPSSDGASANIVFARAETQEGPPAFGGALPAFASPIEGSELLEQATRTRNQAVFGYVKLSVRRDIDSILTHYEATFRTAHYKTERQREPDFGRVSGTASRGEGNVDLFVEKGAKGSMVTLKLEPSPGRE